MSKLKTPISYYGGKQNMVSAILPLIPKHRIYTEAFFGGGAIFFAKPPSEAEVINDTNNMVMNFFEQTKTNFKSLKAKIENTLFSRATYTVALTMYRMPHLFGKLQLACAFYIATNMGFSSSIGSWGYDKYSKRLKSFQNRKMAFDESICQRLQGAQIECNDACKVIQSRDTVDTFHYVDPPYINSDQGHYGGYTEEDYKRLLDCLSKVKGKFLLSSYPSDILSEYTKRNGWHTLVFDKPLSAGKATSEKGRNRKIEVLTANYALEAQVN